jgi:hypothetical protein
MGQSKGPKSSGKSGTSRSLTTARPEVCGKGTRGGIKDRKEVLLQRLSAERSDLLKAGICSADDPMIRDIETELLKHGFPRVK